MIRIQGKIAAGVMQRVGHQYQMRIHILGPALLDQRLKGVIGPHVAINHNKGLIAEKRQSPANTTTGFQGFRLAGPGNTHTKTRAITEKRLYLLTQPGGIDHYFAHTRFNQSFHMVLNQGLITDMQQGLGCLICEGTKPFTIPRRENHCFHRIYP